jgi:SpoVK/Ycf46/Vps4 family AAA+-type ATPase
VRIPLKRGILLEGRYGTGKSLTARVTAKVAADNGWTFLMLDRSQGLQSAIEFAQHYQPCVIFAEDIDRCADRDDEDVNDLVNMLDGLISKDMEMMVVLTTNFIEKIDRALLRPGRFDAVISIQPPDAETAERLVHAYARDLLDETADLSEVGEVIAGQIPATIREVVERAKLAMLTEGRKFLTEEDLEVSAIGMKRHMALLEPTESEATPAEKLFDAIKLVMSASVSEAGIEDLATERSLTASTNILERQIDRVEDRQRATHHAAMGAAGAAKKAADNTEKLVGRDAGNAIANLLRPAS